MFKLNKLTMAIAAAGLGAAISLPAQAGEKELLDVLLQNKIITPEQYEQLVGVYVEEQQAYEEEHKSDIKVTTKGGLKAESNDGAFKFQVGGRIMADATFGSDDNSRINDMNKGTEFRRARIFFKGQLNNDWAYKSQLDFADNNLDVKDMYLMYKPYGLTIGQFKQPFSLEEQTSSRYSTFMERGLPNVLVTGRRVGLGYRTGWDMGTLAVSLYGQNAGDGEIKDETQEGFGGGARVTIAPLNEPGNVLHFGLAGALESSPKKDDTIRVRSRPEAHNSPRLVDTKRIQNVDDLTRIGVEAAWVAGPFSLQSEWMQLQVSRDHGSKDVDFDGWYANASWFLTGESRPYKKGKFGRIKPFHPLGKDGFGAWEIAARYSELDLSDYDLKRGLTTKLGDNAGKLEDVTIGLNWYATDHVRFMMNYVWADADYGNSVDDNPDVLEFRAQIDW